MARRRTTVSDLDLANELSIPVPLPQIVKVKVLVPHGSVLVGQVYQTALTRRTENLISSGYLLLIDHYA